MRRLLLGNGFPGGARRTRGRFDLTNALAAGLLAAALLGSGCAYFNTFYLAKKSFTDAERVRLKSDPDKVSPDAVSKYDKAIEQCRKVIRNHPGSRWADDAVLLMGASFFGQREYENALKTFDDLLVNYPESNLRAQAHYLSGLCEFERRDYQPMETSFQAALELDPEFRHRDDILFTMAKAAERERHRGEAVRRYRELTVVFPGSVRADEALLKIGDLYFDASRYDSALASYGELARTTHQETFFQEGRLKASDTLIRLGRQDEAADLIRSVIPRDEQQRAGEEFPARARLVLARAENARGNHEEALTELRKVATLFAATPSGAEAKFQIGYTYEVYMDSLAAAKTAYEEASKVISKSAFKEQAQVRLRNLEALQSLTAQAEGSGDEAREAKADASLKIAELFLFSQSRPTEALTEYRKVATEFGDTRVAPRAAYAVGWIQLRELEGMRDSALTQFATVIRRWPASRAAHAALDLLVSEQADTIGLTGLLEETEPETLLQAAPAPVDTSRKMSSIDGDEAQPDTTEVPGEELRHRFERHGQPPRATDPRSRLRPGNEVVGERPVPPRDTTRTRADSLAAPPESTGAVARDSTGTVAPDSSRAIDRSREPAVPDSAPAVPPPVPAPPDTLQEGIEP